MGNGGLVHPPKNHLGPTCCLNATLRVRGNGYTVTAVVVVLVVGVVGVVVVVVVVGGGGGGRWRRHVLEPDADGPLNRLQMVVGR